VKGKNDGRSRIWRSAPNIARAKASSVPRRSAIVTPSATYSPSIWLNTGEWVASTASAR
jgi:hypothetical protein